MLEKRCMIRKTILTKNNPMKIDRFMKDSRTISSINDNNFAPKFQLDKKYETADTTFSIPPNNIGVNDSLSHSGSSAIDEYTLDIEDNYDNVINFGAQQ